MNLNECLREYVNGQLRIELTLRRPELKSGIVLDERLIWDYFERVQSGNMEVIRLKDGRPNLKPNLELVLESWLHGNEVKVRLPRKTFYRYRLAIKAETGIDISIPRSDQEDAVERAHFDIEYLKAHEISGIPDYLQQFLFKPELVGAR